MPDQVPPEAKAERNQALRALSRAQTEAFAQRFEGQHLVVVIERGRHDRAMALADNYVRVPVVGDGLEIGTRARVRIDREGERRVARA